MERLQCLRPPRQRDRLPSKFEFHIELDLKTYLISSFCPRRNSRLGHNKLWIWWSDNLLYCCAHILKVTLEVHFPSSTSHVNEAIGAYWRNAPCWNEIGLWISPWDDLWHKFVSNFCLFCVINIHQWLARITPWDLKDYIRRIFTWWTASYLHFVGCIYWYEIGNNSRPRRWKFDALFKKRDG